MSLFQILSSVCPKQETLCLPLPLERITLSLNVRHSDGCENDMSAQCSLQLTSHPSTIRPVTHVQVYQDLSCVCVRVFCDCVKPSGQQEVNVVDG